MFTIELFKQISKVPRPSGHEEKIASFLMSLAHDSGYKVHQDSFGNLCICVDAKGNGVGKEVLVLQAHMDMVCEVEEGVHHNFMSDPISVYEEDGFLKAKHTTLGADNGIGVALAFYCAQLPNHPPLEIVLTVDEERHLVGAKNIQGDFFSGKRLINLDGGGDNQIIVGCAGSAQADIKIFVDYDHAYPTSFIGQWSIDGLRGGHSGVQIHEGRTSAVQVFLQHMQLLSEKKIDYRLVGVDIGGAANAIAYNGCATLAFTSQAMLDQAIKLFETTNFEYKDEQAKWRLISCKEGQFVPYSQASTQNLLEVLACLPHGVLSWSKEWPHIVETSSNVASLHHVNNVVEIVVFYRSFLSENIIKLGQQLQALVRSGVSIDVGEPDPAWTPHKSNRLVPVVAKAFQKLYGKAIVDEPVHAGLECGHMERAKPGLHAVSMGPLIYNMHSIYEKLDIASVERMQDVLSEIMMAID